MTNAELATKLARAAVLLRDLGGEEEYDLADACEDAAQMMLQRNVATCVDCGRDLSDEDLRSTDPRRCDSCEQQKRYDDSATESIEMLTDPSDRDDGNLDRLLVHADKTLRCRYSDCPGGHPVAGDGEEVSCPACREDLGISAYVPSLEAKVEQMIGDIAPDDEDVVPAELRDLIGPKDDAEKQRRRRQMIAENVRLRMEAQERGRPLPDAAWEALSEAELRLYRDGLGLNGWTDVMENDGSETLNVIWDQAVTYVEQDPEQFPDRMQEIAERTAAALSILAFGIGATDLSRLGEAAGH